MVDHLDAPALSRALKQHGLGELTGYQQIERGNWRQNVAVETTSGSYVFRCQPLFKDQFQIEAEAISFLAASSLVPVPSPYVLDMSRSVLPWEYAVMPLLEGVPVELAVLPPVTQIALARATGELLNRLHSLETDSDGFPLLAGRGMSGADPLLKAHENIETCLARQFLTPTEAREVQTNLRAWTETTPAKLRLSFVHGDFQLSNLLVSAADPSRITALLDFAGAHFGHSAEDLPRQLCGFLDLDPSGLLARTFLAGYGGNLPALPLYLLCERLDLWVFIRDMQVGWVDQSLSFTDWLAPYFDAARHWAAPPLS
jgi:hygromycin-B 7''-O-kinase